MELDQFCSDYYNFCSLLNGKDSQSGYYDLLYSSQILENKEKVIQKLSSFVDNLGTSYNITKKKLSSGLLAVNKCITNMKSEPELTIKYKTKSGKLKDLKTLMEIDNLNKNLFKLKENFETLYNNWKVSIQNLINLANKYNADIENINLVKDSAKFDEEFPKIDKLDENFMAIILRSISLEDNVSNITEKLIKALVDKITTLKNEVFSNFEIFQKVNPVKDLRKEEQEAIKKSLSLLEKIEEEKLEILKNKTTIENVNQLIKNLLIKINQQQEFINELWQIYQSRLNEHKELINLKEKLKKIQQDNKGPFSLHQYILNFKNLESLTTEEIHKKLLESAEEIFRLALAGHLQLKFDVIKTDEEE